MFTISTSSIHAKLTLPNAKSDSFKVDTDVSDKIKLSFVNLGDYISNYNLYQAIQWVCWLDKWNRATRPNLTTYHRGDIVLLELGSMNFGHEPSYPHLCVVLENKYDSILIVPCSSKQYGH